MGFAPFAMVAVNAGFVQSQFVSVKAKDAEVFVAFLVAGHFGPGDGVLVIFVVIK